METTNMRDVYGLVVQTDTQSYTRDQIVHLQTFAQSIAPRVRRGRTYVSSDPIQLLNQLSCLLPSFP